MSLKIVDAFCHSCRFEFFFHFASNRTLQEFLSSFSLKKLGVFCERNFLGGKKSETFLRILTKTISTFFDLKCIQKMGLRMMMIWDV